jgi:hypothetical protein
MRLNEASIVESGEKWRLTAYSNDVRDIVAFARYRVDTSSEMFSGQETT